MNVAAWLFELTRLGRGDYEVFLFWHGVGGKDCLFKTRGLEAKFLWMALGSINYVQAEQNLLL
jgi:hypothetical protein